MNSHQIKEPKNMRTFVVIWIGQLISILGSGLTSFALGVWIFEQTGKATPFAITVLFSTLPGVLLGPVAGSVADRFNRRMVMMVSDSLSALITIFTAYLLFTDQLTIWSIYLIALVSSVFSAFQEPAFQASVVMLVPKKDLMRANGMSQLTNALVNLIPPILAGFLFVFIGLEGILVIDFVTYFAAIGTMLAVRIPQPKYEPAPGKQSSWKEALAGWDYLKLNRGLLGLVVYFAVVNFMVNLAAVLTSPMVLANYDARILGTVQMFGGIGMLLGSLLLSAWGGPKKKVLGILLFIACESLGLGIAGLRPNWIFMAAGYFVILFFVPLASGSSQAIYQTKVPANIQGRVFAIRSMISRSIMPFAFLIAGPLADVVFEPLMAEGGALSQSFIATVIGSGPGRGIGLIFILAMMGELLATFVAFLNPRIRNIETEVPDIVIDSTEQENRTEVEGEEVLLPASD